MGPRIKFAACLVPWLLLAGPGALDAFEPLPERSIALLNGDTNGDFERDLSDGIYLLGHLYLGSPAPVPLALCGGEEPAYQNGDSNGDGSLDISDLIFYLRWLFSGGREPVAVCSEGAATSAGDDDDDDDGDDVPFSGVVRVFGVQNPAECFIVPPPPPFVFEGCISPETIEGDISLMNGDPAPGLIVFDQEVDATGSGEFEGDVTFGEVGALACVTDPSGVTLCGIFEGEVEADLVGGAPFAGEFEVKGISGDVEGVKIEGTTVETAVGSFIFELKGTIRFAD